jgi:hypothetical protein
VKEGDGDCKGREREILKMGKRSVREGKGECKGREWGL